MGEPPLVSIGIPTYDHPEGLRRILDCAAGQTYRNLEIIVSDNGSPDAGVLEIANRCAAEDARIRVFRQPGNIGPFKNHEFVKQQAHGKYFAWFSDDDEFPENYVEVCVRHLEAEKNAVLVGPCGERFVDGRYAFTYDNWSNLGQSAYERLRNLIPNGFTQHWRFEQYWYGLFLRAAAAKHVSNEFKAAFHHFFVLAEAGAIIHAPELKLVKHSTRQKFQSYGRGDVYRKHWALRCFGGDVGESVQQCVPITLQMLQTILGSKRLSAKEKVRLVARTIRLFIRYPVKDQALRFRRRWK